MAKNGDNFVWRSTCPICSGLDVLGDKWTMLVVRDLTIHGPRTYSQLLESPERISTNILADRLDLLVSLDLIERVHPEKSARNNAFKLTKSGEALRPILDGIAVWATTHLRKFHRNIASVAPKKKKK